MTSKELYTIVIFVKSSYNGTFEAYASEYQITSLETHKMTVRHEKLTVNQLNLTAVKFCFLTTQTYLAQEKNLGRLWLAYTELQGELYMLQLIYVDSRYFTPS